MPALVDVTRPLLGVSLLSLACACGGEASLRAHVALEQALLAQDTTLTSISAGNGHVCALRDDGGITCWGLDNYDQSIPPSDTGYDEVSSGSRFTCALRDGAASCWGLNNLGQTDAPGLLLRAMSSGDDHTCALTADGNDGVVHPADDPVWFDYGSPCNLFQDDDGSLYFWDASGTRGGLACSDFDGDVVSPSRDVGDPGSCWTPIFAKRPGGTSIVTPIAGVAAGATSEIELSSNDCNRDNNKACTVRWKPRDVAVSGDLGSAGAGWYVGAANVVVTKPAWGETCPLAGSLSDFTWSPPGTGTEDPSCTQCDGTRAVWSMDRRARPDFKWQYVDNPHAHPTVVIVHEGDFQSTTDVAPENRPDAQSTIASEHWPMYTMAVLGNMLINNGTVLAIGVGTPRNGFPSIIVNGQLQMPTNSRLLIAGNFFVSGNIVGPEQLTSFAQPNHFPVCWGANASGQASAPARELSQVSAGGDHSCGIVRDTSEVVCWGANNAGQSTPPAGAFVEVSAGGAHTCAVDVDGGVQCWGHDGYGQASVPAGLPPASHVAASDLHTCILDAVGSLHCWGGDFDGRASPPAGTFDSISAGDNFTCATTAEGGVACWGKSNYGQVDVPVEELSMITSGMRFSCGLVVGTSEVACFGRNDVGQASPPPGAFNVVSAGYMHACGLRADGTAECWGADSVGQLDVPAASFVALSAGGYHSCGLDASGLVSCWGSNSYGQATAPAEPFVSVAAGLDHTCAQRADGTIACWGRGLSKKTTPPAGAFASLYAGRHHNCALDASGNATCWGLNNFGQIAPPARTFKTLFLGGEQSCGMTTSDELVCWGSNEWGKGVVPAGGFTAAGVGDSHVCALDGEGRAICWGYIARNL